MVEKFRASGIQITIKVLPDKTWEVSLDDQPVQDLSPLRGAQVTGLSVRNTKITDLKTVAGMSLKTFSFQGTKVSDLTPLTGMPLEDRGAGTRTGVPPEDCEKCAEAPRAAEPEVHLLRTRPKGRSPAPHGGRILEHGRADEGRGDCLERTLRGT